MDEEVSALIDELVGKITRILTTKGLHDELARTAQQIYDIGYRDGASSSRQLFKLSKTNGYAIDASLRDLIIGHLEGELDGVSEEAFFKAYPQLRQCSDSVSKMLQVLAEARVIRLENGLYFAVAS